MFPEEAQGIEQYSGYYIFMMLFHFFTLPLPKVCIYIKKKSSHVGYKLQFPQRQPKEDGYNLLSKLPHQYDDITCLLNVSSDKEGLTYSFK